MQAVSLRLNKTDLVLSVRKESVFDWGGYRLSIKDKTVEYTECVYLDQGYNSLYVNYERPTQNMNTMSVKDVDYNFYQAILDYEKEHRKELLTKIIDQVKSEDLKAAGITLTKEQKKNMKENKKQRR